MNKNYIKMCEHAEEIQKVCKYEGGEHFVNVAQEIEIMPFGLIEKMKEWYKYYYHIWLPTQEQLQEMVKDRLFYISGSFKDIYASASTGNRDSHVVCKKAKSMNELWLAFVMKEKYNKMWNGKTWVAV